MKERRLRRKFSVLVDNGVGEGEALDSGCCVLNDE